jgi:hypothetical protein
MIKRSRQMATSSNLAPRTHAIAEVAASARYEFRKNVTEHIPVDVTRAKASAWLTLLSPITQWAGLKGDQLAYKRELLRIQQDETLTEIARRAAPRIARLDKPISPVPTKFLVQFLEKASLEEPDSKLVELWASLLVSSAENYNPHFIYYINIISQMSSVQAQLFERIIGPKGPHNVLIALERVNCGFMHDFLLDHINICFKESDRPLTTSKRIWSFLGQILTVPGMPIEHVELIDETKDEHLSGLPLQSAYKDDLRGDFEILSGLRLLNYVDTGFFMIKDRWNVKVMAHHVSTLGLSFASACGVPSRPRRSSRSHAALSG